MAMNLAYILPRVCFFFVILNVSYFLLIEHLKFQNAKTYGRMSLS